jgi:PEP-CTERM motif
MPHRIQKLLFLVFALAGFSTFASAQVLYVGDVSYDEGGTNPDQLDITNLVGNGLAQNTAGGAVTATTFDIDVTSVTVTLAGGSSVVIPGSDFTSVDGAGDLDCNASACDLAGDDITSAVVTGTFTETGLTGLDAGYSGIDDAFTATVSPSCGTTYLDPGCDTGLITATETASVVSTPEPGTFALLGVGLIGLFAAWKRLRRDGYSRFTPTAVI